MESQIIKERKVSAFSCYYSKTPKNTIKYQKKVFDKFNMHINQELTTCQGRYLDNVMKNSDLDIVIFCDIDAISLKFGFYEYIVDQIKDNNSFIGTEQAANHIDYRQIYAGTAFMGLTKKVYNKLGNPTFQQDPNKYDIGGKLTIVAKNKKVNVKYFYIKSSLNKLWRCGENKWFGLGTTYDNWCYHQFQTNNLSSQIQFVNKCKDILKNN